MRLSSLRGRALSGAAVVSSVLIAYPPPVFAAESVQKLTVNIQTGIIDPIAPAINIRTSQTVIFVIEPGDLKYVSTKIVLPTFVLQAKAGEPGDEPARSNGKKNDWKCPGKPPPPAWELVSKGDEISEKQIALTFYDGRDREVEKFLCENRIEMRPGLRANFAIATEDGLHRKIFAEKNTTLIIAISFKRPPNDSKVQETMIVPVQLDSRDYALDWSAGFAAFGARDRRYRTEPIVGNDEQVRLMRASDGSLPYQLAAFAHYKELKPKGWWGKHFETIAGVGLDVPVEQVSLMLGLGVTADTFPFSDSGHLILGAAYTPVKRLKADFEGRSLVNSGISGETVVEDRHELTWFFGVSFSFLGGRERFEGVYSKPESEEK